MPEAVRDLDEAPYLKVLYSTSTCCAELAHKPAWPRENTLSPPERTDPHDGVWKSVHLQVMEEIRHEQISSVYLDIISSSRRLMLRLKMELRALCTGRDCLARHPVVGVHAQGTNVSNSAA